MVMILYSSYANMILQCMYGCLGNGVLFLECRTIIANQINTKTENIEGVIMYTVKQRTVYNISLVSSMYMDSLDLEYRIMIIRLKIE